MRWFLLVVLLGGCASAGVPAVEEVPWMEFVRAGRMLAAGCRRSLSTAAGAGEDLLECVEARTLRALDRLLARDVLDLPFGVKLIRDRDIKDDDGDDARRRDAPSSVGMLNATLSRAARLLRTHSLSIPLPSPRSLDIFDSSDSDSDTSSTTEGRRRHRHRNNDMMGLMLFGVMAMTVIAIPMGFQFLAVLGGKALMLAKLALILTSIQGLKKVATSNLNYGLYHAPPHHHSRPLFQGLYDRRWHPEHGEHEHEHGALGGLFDGFDAPPESHAHALDGIRPRIMFPRLGFTDNGIEHQQGEHA